MKKQILLIIIAFFCIGHHLLAQQFLPNLNVKSYNGKVVVSWMQNFKKNISSILIQRSYDSTRNFSTIGTVLNPQALENGYPDQNPPYDRMFYRVTITFEGGTYLIGPSYSPTREPLILPELDVTYYPAEPEPPAPEKMIEKILDTPSVPAKPEKTVSKKDSVISSNPSAPKNHTEVTPIKEKALPWELNHSFDSSKVIIPKKTIETNYPSNRVFINKQQFIAINLPEADKKKYSIKFFDEQEKLVFELKKLTEPVYYLDKSNFFHAGWFFLEIYENGELIEKNRIFVAKDKPKSIP